MATTFQQTHADAWNNLGIGTREAPAEIFPPFKKQDFEQLKNDYNAQYGYTIRIPQWDDIIHLTPDAMKSDAVIKAEKKANLVRILDSPAPELVRNITTVMTWIDDIQDTSSIVIPMVSMLARMAPKVFGKLISVAGWMLLGYDLLNLATAAAYIPFKGMIGKRTYCPFTRQNPFGKVARLQRMGRVRNYKPGIADLIQVAQVLDQFTGAGLSLGGVMGAITDSIAGGVRYLMGQPVRFTFDPPQVDNLQRMGARGLRAASAISSAGQTFDDLTHFWTYVTAGLSSMALSGFFREHELTDLIENPTQVALEAPRPTNPNTIAVIEEMGLNVEEGVGWPFNGQKIISLGDYIDATHEASNTNFHAYCLRHKKDSYGFIAAQAMDSLIPQTLLAMDPDGSVELDDTNEMKVFWKMVKVPLLPTTTPSQEQADKFFAWSNEYTRQYGNTPGIMEIEEKFKMLGIQYRTSYPQTADPNSELYWPPGFQGIDSF